jgi:hypothetical protein
LIKNPREIGIDLPDGDYVLHSGYGKSEESGQMFYGVHLEKLQDVIKQYPTGGVDIRIVHARRGIYFYEKLKQIHQNIHARPYDTNLLDWISAVCRKRIVSVPGWYRNTHRFWCSALVSYVYEELDWVSDIDWTLVSPGELAGSCLRWTVPVEAPKSLPN